MIHPKQIKSTLIVTFLMLFTLLGCKEEECNDVLSPECPNYDACVATPSPSADFILFKGLSKTINDTTFTIELPITDTTYSGGPTMFRAQNINDNYDWMVGDDSRMIDTREFRLNFPRQNFDNLQVSLTVDKNIAECPERGQESATSTASYTFIKPEIDEIPIVGRFTGNNEDETSEGDFTIDFAIGPNGAIHLRNLPRGADNDDFFNDVVVTTDYKSFLFLPTLLACCKRAHGSGHLSDDKNELRIEYSIYDESTEIWTPKIWTGSRVE